MAIMEESLNTVGKRLRYARDVLRDISQPELGKRLGVTQQAISQWENDETAKPRDLLVAAHELKISYEWLKNNKGPMEPIVKNRFYDLASMKAEDQKAFEAIFGSSIDNWMQSKKT